MCCCHITIRYDVVWTISWTSRNVGLLTVMQYKVCVILGFSEFRLYTLKRATWIIKVVNIYKKKVPLEATCNAKTIEFMCFFFNGDAIWRSLILKLIGLLCMNSIHCRKFLQKIHKRWCNAGGFALWTLPYDATAPTAAELSINIAGGLALLNEQIH